MNDHLVMQRGTSLVFAIDVENEDTEVAFDLTTTGVTAVLTVAKTRGGTPLVTQTYTAASPAGNQQLKIGATNAQLVATIRPADTASLTADTMLVWDVVVFQADGSEYPVAGGTLLALRGVGS